MSKQIHAHIQGMTTFGSIGSRCYRSLVSLNSPPRGGIGADLYDDTAENFSESLANEPRKIRPELQAPSNDATEDGWLISIENNDVDDWLISIENDDVDDTTDEPQIQRIPSLLRYKQCYRNENCFVPRLVSIGPYHHGNQQLNTFEDLKISVARIFIRGCGYRASIIRLYEEVAKEYKSARECYEKGSTDCYDDKLFNKMMFLDACFVLYFIKYISLENKGTDKEEEKADPLHHWRCHLVSVQRDLFLLENQIPLLVLKALMKFLFLDQNAIMPPEEKFLAQMMGCSVQKKEKLKLARDASRPHLLHLVREQLIGSSPDDKNKKKAVKWYHRSVTELKSAGIHFRPSQTNHVTDVKFKSHLSSGTLTLPPIVVDDSTKDLLLNLVAYEMCPSGPSNNHITSYVCLMDSLIDRADDVEELRRRRILVNHLGSDEELAQLFNEIAKDLVFDPYAYADVKRQIQNHCKSKARVWMAEWIHNHFSSPWAFLALLGVILVIALTAVQAYFTVLSYEASRH